MEIAYYCMSIAEHMFRGKNLDGIRCPYCDSLVNIKPVSSEVYKELPKYRDIRQKNANEIEITIKLNGKKIDKHTIFIEDGQ